MILHCRNLFSKVKLIIGLLLTHYCLLNACTPSIYKGDAKKSAAARELLTPTDTFMRNERKGIDLFASGNDPVNWTLALDLEKDFTFKPSGGQTLIATPVPANTQDGIDSYVSKTDAGMMKVIVYSELCAAVGNGKPSRKVEVTISNKRYTGCGKYLYDFLLNDIWELEYVDNTEPSVPEYKKQLPRMEFDLEKNKMLGYDGCNNINADIVVQRNHIKFSAFTGSNSNCATAKLFTEKLSGRTVDFYIKDDKLVIYLINDSKLTFKKAK